MIELSEIKLQCRIEIEDTYEDCYLEMLLKAAQSYIDTFLNQKVRWDGSTGDIPLYHDIKLAALMLIGHWYENREATTAINLKEVPLATNCLLEQYRVIQTGYLRDSV